MSNEVIVTPNFRKEAKPLLKKYPSLKNELNKLEEQLILHPEFGTALGGNAYKIRLAVKSKGKGKSGGMCVITYLDINFSMLDSTRIFLLSIYDKSEIESISKEELKRLIASSKK